MRRQNTIFFEGAHILNVKKKGLFISNKPDSYMIEVTDWYVKNFLNTETMDTIRVIAYDLSLDGYLYQDVLLNVREDEDIYYIGEVE
jgi:hypothetical protein